jgi:hypothetical protein
MCAFLSGLHSANPGAITSAVFFDDNPAAVKCINEKNSSETKMFPVVAKDLNSESACKYIGDNHQKIGCCMHMDVDALADMGNVMVVVSIVEICDDDVDDDDTSDIGDLFFGHIILIADDLKKIIGGTFYMLQPDGAGFMFFNHRKCLDFAGFCKPPIAEPKPFPPHPPSPSPHIPPHLPPTSPLTFPPHPPSPSPHIPPHPSLQWRTWARCSCITPRRSSLSRFRRRRRASSAANGRRLNLLHRMNDSRGG